MLKNKSILIMLLIVFISGCSGLQFESDNIYTVAAISEIASRNIGCEVSKDGDAEVDRSLRNIYLSVKAGNLTDDAVKQLSELTESRPTLAADVASLIKLFGVNTQAETVTVEPIPPEIFNAIETGYLQGIELCKNLGD